MSDATCVVWSGLRYLLSKEQKPHRVPELGLSLWKTSKKRRVSSSCSFFGSQRLLDTTKKERLRVSQVLSADGGRERNAIHV